MPYDPKDWGKSQEKQNTIILDLDFPKCFYGRLILKETMGLT